MINLTQHNPTPDQIAAGVVTPHNADAIRWLLTFEVPPSRETLFATAKAMAWAAIERSAYIDWDEDDWDEDVEIALRAQGFTPYYAFSVRDSVDQTQPDGSVQKVAVFRHIGFIEWVAE
jgi:hypothetical protein